MKRALVLSGGAARGAFQVGMLKQLVIDRGLDFDILRGVSVGSINASFLAQAVTGPRSQQALAERVESLERFWRRDIRGNHSIYAPNAGGVAALAAWGDALYSVKPLHEMLHRHISPKLLRESGRNLRVGTVSLVDGLYKEWNPENGDPHFVDRILASSSIPVTFPPVRFPHEEELLVDGGVRNITPLSGAFDAGAEEIYVLLASRVNPADDGSLPDSTAEQFYYRQWDDNWLGTKLNGLDILQRSVSLLTDEIYLKDIRNAIEWNRFLWRAEKLALAYQNTGGRGGSTAVTLEAKKLDELLRQQGKRHVPIHVLAPRRWYGDEDNEPGKRNQGTDFSPKLIRRAIDHGFEVALDQSQWIYSTPRDS